MWYYLFKDDKQIDYIHTPSENKPFEQFNRSDLITKWLTFDDETIPTFFLRVCQYTSTKCFAVIDGCVYSVDYEDE